MKSCTHAIKTVVSFFVIIHAAQCHRPVGEHRLRKRSTPLPYPLNVTASPPSLHIAGHFRPCGADQFARILFPTVPRSGSSMTRLLLENATGIGTGSVFRAVGGWNERARAFVHACGAIADCTHVHASNGSDPIVIKTHYPFFGARDVAFSNDCVSGIMMTVRHPLDNYVAWMTYLGRQKVDQPVNGDVVLDVTRVRDEMSLSKFVTLWQQHHTYWHAYAVKHSIPLLQVRYEDMCAQPRAAMTRVLRFLSVFEQINLDRVPEASPFGHDCTLRNVRKFPEATAWVTQDELDTVLTGTRSYVVDAFGYERRVDVARDFVGRGKGLHVDGR